MGLLWSALIGLIAGAIAKFLMPGRDPKGCIITMIIGLVGAVIATFLGRMLGFYREGESAGLIGAIVGSIILLALYRMFLKRRS